MKTKTSILIAVLFMLTGCNTTHNMRMAPIKSQEQTVIYNDGKQTITSSKYYFVSLAPYKSLNNSTSNTSYILYVQNLGSDPVTISSDNVNVRFKKRLEDGSVNEIPVSVLTYTDLLQEIQAEEKKQRNAAAWAAFAGTLNAANSAYSTSNTYNSGTYSGNLNSYNSYGNYSGLYNGFSTTTTYDPAKAQALANQNNQIFQNNIQSIAANANSSRQLLEQLVMKAQTISPGQGHGGLVVTETRSFNHKDEGNFEIIVSIGGEEHIFTVNRSLHTPKNK